MIKIIINEEMQCEPVRSNLSADSFNKKFSI